MPDDKTKEELLEEAREADVEGRSSMTKDELAAALEGDDASSAPRNQTEESGTSDFARALEEDKGFIGAEVDPTPNHAYTVEGVANDEPTPETDEDAYDAAKQQRRDIRELTTPEGTSLGRQAD